MGPRVHASRPEGNGGHPLTAQYVCTCHTVRSSPSSVFQHPIETPSSVGFLLEHRASPHCRALILTLIGEEEEPARRSGERHCSG